MPSPADAGQNGSKFNTSNMLNYKIKNIILVTSSALLFLGWVVFRIVFPVFHFDYNGQSEDGNFFIREINQKTYLQLKLKGGYSFNKIILKIKPGKNNVALGDVYQDELALYKQDRTINSLEELKKYLIVDGSNIYNGQLINHGDSVFFIENNHYRAFANAMVFDNLGFDWKKIAKTDDSVFNKLAKGKHITNTTRYLNDSFVRIDNKIYLLNNNEKILINDIRAKEFIEDKFSLLDIDKKKSNFALVGKMICQKTSFGEKCFLKRNKATVFPRAEILMEMQDKSFLEDNKVSARVDTFDGIHSVVPKITIRNIKRLIKIRYEDEVIKLKSILK